MNNVSRTILIIVLMGAVGSWLMGIQNNDWRNAFTPLSLGSLLVGLGSTLGAAFGVKKSE